MNDSLEKRVDFEIDFSKLCLHFVASRHHRMIEDGYGWDHKGTGGYNRYGCFDCKGLNEECSYHSINEKVVSKFYPLIKEHYNLPAITNLKKDKRGNQK